MYGKNDEVLARIFEGYFPAQQVRELSVEKSVVINAHTCPN